ncbi:MAG TPA: hypothetical protein VE127_04520, partial [Solirubrobacteraceae bacterium]|nr:hypothetical protein [Solirubrobacteraceae bacterium]
FEKLLADGRLLKTHISHDRHAVVSAGRFSSILTHQIEVNRQEFWEAIRTGDPVSRPVPTDPVEAVELPGWVVKVLVEDLHMEADQIAELDPEEAKRLVQEFWTRPT